MKKLILFLLLTVNVIAYAQKIDRTLLQNNWKAVKLNGVDPPNGINMIFIFTEDKLNLGSEYNRLTHDYTLVKNKIVFLNEDEKLIYWVIKKLNEKQLFFLDENKKLIKLERTEQSLPELTKKNKNSNDKALPLPPPPPPPPYTHSNDENVTNTSGTEPEIFTLVEEEPTFPGCEDIVDKTEKQRCSVKKMISFLGLKAGYPNEAKMAGFEGTVFIRFVVETDGTISNIEVLKDQTPGGGLKEAALDAVNAMNSMDKKWNPGLHRGIPVRVRVVAPVKFKLL
jgi:TonB family protein